MRLLLYIFVITHALYSECPPGQSLTTPYDGSPQEFQDMRNSLLGQLEGIAKDDLKDAAGDLPIVGPLVNGYDALDFLNETYSNCRATGSSNCLAFTAFCFGIKQAQDLSIGPFPLKTLFPPMEKWCKGEPVLKCCARTGLHQCHSAFNEDAPINCEGNPAYGPTWTPGICMPTNRYPGDPGCLCDYLPKCAAISPGQGQCTASASASGRRLLNTQAYCGALNTYVNYDVSSVPVFNETFNGTWIQVLKGSYVPEGSALVNSPFLGPFPAYINPFATNFTFRTVSSPEINFAKRSMFIRDLRQQFLTIITTMSQDSSQRDALRDFLSFRGCKGFAKAINPLLQQYLNDPDAFLQTIPYYTYTIYNGAPTRNDTFSRATDLFRRTVDFSIGRVIAAIPYFWGRFDFATSFEWSQEDKVSYFLTLPLSPLERGSTTYLRAEAALLPLLGPVGLAILQSSEIVDWELFAPPLPVSTPGWGAHWLGNESQWLLEGKNVLAGCELGEPPLLSLAVSENVVDGDLKTVLNLTFTDPEHIPGLRVPIRVEWGDATVSRAFFVEPSQKFRMTTSITHKYIASGLVTSPVLIKASIFNGAGLAARASVVYTPTTEAIGTAAPVEEAQLQTNETQTAYGLPGFVPLLPSSLPASFQLRTACGRYFGASGQLMGTFPSGVSLSVDTPADLYDATEGTLCRISANGGYVNHNNMLLVLSPYVPNSTNFAWQFFLQSGTFDQVAVWNPWPGDGIGSYLSDDGIRFRIDGRVPSIFTLTDSSFSLSASESDSSKNWKLRGEQLLGSVNAVRVNVRIDSDARSQLEPIPTQFEVLRAAAPEVIANGSLSTAAQVASLTALFTIPTYGLSGFHPLAKEALPPNFKLTSKCGACWSSVVGLLYEGAYGVRFNAEPLSGGPVGTYLLRANTLYLRTNTNNNNNLELRPFNSSSLNEFHWQLFLEDNTTDQVILWSPALGGGYLISDGSRPFLGSNSTLPLVFTLSQEPPQDRPLFYSAKDRPLFYSAAAFTFLTPAANFSLDPTSVFSNTQFAVNGAPLGIRVQCRSYDSYIYTLPRLSVLSLDVFVDQTWVTIPGGEFTSVVYNFNNSNTSQTISHRVERGSFTTPCARRGNVEEDEGSVLELYFSKQSLASRLARLLPPPMSWASGDPIAETEVRPGLFLPVAEASSLGTSCSSGSECASQECLIHGQAARSVSDPYECGESPSGTCSVLEIADPTKAPSSTPTITTSKTQAPSLAPNRTPSEKPTEKVLTATGFSLTGVESLFWAFCCITIMH